MKKGLKILDSIAKKGRGKGVFRLRMSNGQFASTGRTGVNIKGKARLKTNYKNTVASVRLDLDKKLRGLGRSKVAMRPLGFEIIEGTNLTDKTAKATKVIQKAKLNGKTGVSARDVKRMIAERNKRLSDRQTFGQNSGSNKYNPGVSANAQASGTWRGVKWSANINWNNRKLQTGIAVLSAGAILRGGYELYEKNRSGKS